MQHMIPDATTALCPCASCRRWYRTRPQRRPRCHTYVAEYTYTARLADGTYRPASGRGPIEGESPIQAMSKLRNMLEGLGHREVEITIKLDTD